MKSGVWATGKFWTGEPYNDVYCCACNHSVLGLFALIHYDSRGFRAVLPEAYSQAFVALHLACHHSIRIPARGRCSLAPTQQLATYLIISGTMPCPHV